MKQALARRVDVAGAVDGLGGDVITGYVGDSHVAARGEAPDDGLDRRSQAARQPVYERTRLFRLYEPGLIPGIFQTAPYAAAVIGSFLDFSGVAADLDQAVAARMEWQKIIYGDRDFQVVLEEQALWTRAGNAEVMAGQLDRLLAVMSLPRVSLGIIPSTAERTVMPSAGFLIFDEEMVQAETIAADLAVTQPQEVVLYARRFELLRQAAVYGREARALIQRALNHAARSA